MHKVSRLVCDPESTNTKMKFKFLHACGLHIQDRLISVAQSANLYHLVQTVTHIQPFSALREKSVNLIQHRYEQHRGCQANFFRSRFG